MIVNKSLKSSKYRAVLSAGLLGVIWTSFRLTQGQYEYFILDLSDPLHGCPSWVCNTSSVKTEATPLQPSVAMSEVMIKRWNTASYLWLPRARIISHTSSAALVQPAASDSACCRLWFVPPLWMDCASRDVFLKMS